MCVFLCAWIRCYSQMHNYGLCIMLQPFLVRFVILSNNLHLLSLRIRAQGGLERLFPPKLVFSFFSFSLPYLFSGFDH